MHRYKSKVRYIYLSEKELRPVTSQNLLWFREYISMAREQVHMCCPEILERRMLECYQKASFREDVAMARGDEEVAPALHYKRYYYSYCVTFYKDGILPFFFS
jgi:hypothetical protein